MAKEVEHVCIVCGWQYDESKYGKWENLSDDFECPECAAEKELFEQKNNL
jgi:rubredoxin